MYHARFKKSHYEAGYKWGNLLYKNGSIISSQHTFVITKERKEFAKQCLPIYKKYYPEILEEIRGIADGQKSSYEDLYTFLIMTLFTIVVQFITYFILRKFNMIDSLNSVQ